MRMNKSYLSETLSDYTSLLSAPAYAPGGGSAGALAAALSSALAHMASSLSDLEGPAELEELQQRFLAAVDGDAAAFAPVAEAWAIPKDDPRRPEILEAAHIKAAEAPLELLCLCGRCAALCEELCDQVGEMLLPDVAAAAALCRGAADTAAANVRANTFYMSNRAAAEALNDRAEGLRQSSDAVAAAVYARIYAHLGVGR